MVVRPFEENRLKIALIRYFRLLFLLYTYLIQSFKTKKNYISIHSLALAFLDVVILVSFDIISFIRYKYYIYGTKGKDNGL